MSAVPRRPPDALIAGAAAAPWPRPTAADRPCDVRFRGQSRRRSRCWCPCDGGGRSGRRVRVRSAMTAMRLYNTLTRREEDVRARPGQHRPHVHLRADGLRARPHRQLPHLRLRRRAAPHAEVSARLPRPAGDELHRRRRPDDRRRAEGRHGPARLHRPVHRRRSARTRGRSASSRWRRTRARPTRRTSRRWPR